MIFRQQRLLDPPGSAYRSETGGLMEALRVLTVDQSMLQKLQVICSHHLSLLQFVNIMLRIMFPTICPRAIPSLRKLAPWLVRLSGRKSEEVAQMLETKTRELFGFSGSQTKSGCRAAEAATWTPWRFWPSASRQIRCSI